MLDQEEIRWLKTSCNELNNLLQRLYGYAFLSVEKTSGIPEVQDALGGIVEATEKASLVTESILSYVANCDEFLKAHQPTPPESPFTQAEAPSDPLPPDSPRRALRTIRINLKEIEEQVRAAEKAAKALVEEPSPKSLLPAPPRRTTRVAEDEPDPLVPASSAQVIPSSNPSLKAPGPMTVAPPAARPPATRTVSGMPQPMAPRPPIDAPELEGITIENPEGRGELILVVDDEPEVAALIKSMLIDSQYRVIALHEGIKAVEVYKKAGKYIDLVLLDYAMPIMDGEDVFEELRLINPSVGVILSSGFPPQAKLGSLLARGLRGFMPKPYTRDKLVMQVRQALTLGVKAV